MTDSNKKPHMIGICGASCSGKSSVCDIIKKQFPKKAIIISQDRYYKGGNKDTNYDEPKAIEFTLLIEHMKQLISGKSIKAPRYNFTNHQREKEYDIIQPTPIIVIEGILIFTVPEIRELLDLKVYVRSHRELRFYRRLTRDIKERGRTETEVIDRYFKHVLPSNNFYVEPSEHVADISIVNNDQRFEFIGFEMVLNHIKSKI